MHRTDRGTTSPELTAGMMRTLRERGFATVRSGIPSAQLVQLASAYDRAIARAAPGDVRIGRTTTRVHGLVNYGPEFSSLPMSAPIVSACRLAFGDAFTLSSFLARTVHPGAAEQPLHVDLRVDGDDWPMLGFILMVDDFRPDNGATRFVPESHLWRSPDDAASMRPEELESHAVQACGAAGTIILYSGSVWHGHSANTTRLPRRSIQGAYIRATGAEIRAGES